MRSVAIDGVALSVYLYVCLLVTFVSPANRDAFCMRCIYGWLESLLDGIQIPQRRGNFGSRPAHWKALAAAVYAAKKITNSAVVIYNNAFLLSSWCWSAVEPVETAPVDVRRRCLHRQTGKNWRFHEPATAPPQRFLLLLRYNLYYRCQRNARKEYNRYCVG